MKRIKKLLATLLSVLTVLSVLSTVEVFAEVSTKASSSTNNSAHVESLVNENGIWYYTLNGEKTDATTLVKYYSTWYYVENGVINWNTTTLCNYYGTWYYVKNGVLDWSATTLCNYYGTWYYVKDGVLNWNTTTLCNYYGTWYYVKDGVLDWSATTLCNYYGTWYYVENGVLDWSATTLCNYYGTWYYVENGILNLNAATLCNYYGTLYYVKNGVVNWNATTLCNYGGTWCYIKNGVFDSSANTRYKYYGTWYDVRDGIVVVNSAPAATPNGGKYMNVGSGYIAEIVEYNAETFDGKVTSASLKDGSIDWSRPTNNYLPKGTVDYCSTSNIAYEDTNYVTLRAGLRVYLERKDKPYKEFKPVVRQYIGVLPDHNEIAVASYKNNGTHTVITLDTLWKAPFYFDILPQAYANPSAQDYRINKATYNYIDITFCYATAFSGNINIPSNDPLFKSAQIIKNKSSDKEITLRLYLKKQGAFYGWDSYYNEKGQLCFEFLNPKTVTYANNDYGVDLNGAKILIDVGHGGIDGGASGSNANHNEAERNLNLAYKIKEELIKAGAEVYMTRTDNSTSSTDDKITLLKKIKPDLCIAVHHDSNKSSSANGFSPYYSTPFSKNAAEFISAQTQKLTSVYNKFNETKWHYYFMCRTTNCPVVLTENGFMSNSYDYGNIVNEEANLQKAKAITRGIVDYFKSIQ